MKQFNAKGYTEDHEGSTFEDYSVCFGVLDHYGSFMNILSNYVFKELKYIFKKRRS